MNIASLSGGSRRMCVVVDLEGYRALTGPAQRAAQATLDAGLDQAARTLGLDRAHWFRQETGDGELAVLPDEVPDALVIDEFPDALERALDEHRTATGPRLRIRVCLHVGVTENGALGQAGAGVIVATSIVDAGPVKRAFRSAPGAGLLLALSHTLFEDRVIAGYTRFEPKEFREVRIRGEKFSGRAWVRVPGVSPRQLTIEDDPPREGLPSRSGETPRREPDSESYRSKGDMNVVRGNQTIIASTGPVRAPHGTNEKGRRRA